MTDKNKKQFGVWMDTHHATIVGRDKTDSNVFVIAGHVKNTESSGNSNENSSNHHKIALTHKFFKEIAAEMVNIDEVHVTGTGQIQEQFIKFLSETPQYKHAKSSDSTANKMSDDALIDFFSGHFK